MWAGQQHRVEKKKEKKKACEVCVCVENAVDHNHLTFSAPKLYLTLSLINKMEGEACTRLLLLLSVFLSTFFPSYCLVSSYLPSSTFLSNPSLPSPSPPTSLPPSFPSTPTIPFIHPAHPLTHLQAHGRPQSHMCGRGRGRMRGSSRCRGLSPRA